MQIVNKYPVFRKDEYMTGCCFRDGIMFKSGAHFYEGNTELTCCHGGVYAVIKENGKYRYVFFIEFKKI